MILPYYRLSNIIRVRIALEEIRLGTAKWEDMPTEINGKASILKANKKWGVVIVGRGRFLVTPEYPLIEINSLTDEPIRDPQEPNQQLRSRDKDRGA